MKRIISFSLFFALLLFLFQYAVVYFDQGHDITYSYQSEDLIYEVREHLFLEENEPVYQFTITGDEDVFNFETRTNYNKQDKIISKIISFTEDGFHCLYPVYKDNLNDVHDPICIKDNLEYAYTYLRDRFTNITKVEQNLISQGIILPSWQDNGELTNYQSVKVYQDNVPEQIYLGVWRYHGIEAISKERETYTPLLSNDSYQQKGILVDNLYIIPDYTTAAEFSGIVITNITSFGSRTMELDFRISDDSYFNGVVDGKAYLFDKTNLKQYEINPTTQMIREIGNTDINAQYYDGTKWSDRNIYDYVSQEIIFGKDYQSMEEFKDYKIREMVETEGSYYMIDNNYRLYHFYKNEVSRPILLCQIDGMKELKVDHDYVFFISSDMLYFYHDTYGLKPLVSYNEFLYNSHNLYVAYYQK